MIFLAAYALLLSTSGKIESASNCCSWDNCGECGSTSDYCEQKDHCEEVCGGKWCPGPPGPSPTPPPGTPATTTRYWDCCKASCSWPSNCLGCAAPVTTCTQDGGTGDPNAKNICTGGGDATKPVVYACTNGQPFTKNDILYGFAAGGGNIISNGGCCACYKLTFTSGTVSGKTMIVQVTNTGGDLGTNHFDLQIPGGGFGIYDGCSGSPPNGPAQFPEPDSAWGQRYGGVADRAACDGLPPELWNGCRWRFDDFLAADNPAAVFDEVTCPDALTSISGCQRINELKNYVFGAVYNGNVFDGTLKSIV